MVVGGEREGCAGGKKVLGLYRRNLVLCLHIRFMVMAVRGKDEQGKRPHRGRGDRRAQGLRLLEQAQWVGGDGSSAGTREGGTQVLGLIPHGLDKAL